jgi:hypothetical protein
MAFAQSKDNCARQIVASSSARLHKFRYSPVLLDFAILGSCVFAAMGVWTRRGIFVNGSLRVPEAQ